MENTSILRNEYRERAKSAHDTVREVCLATHPKMKKALGKEDQAAGFIEFMKDAEGKNPWEILDELSTYAKGGKQQKKVVEAYLAFCKEYRAYVRKFPSMVRMNTLTAALAFAKQKSQDGNAWGCLYHQLEAHLVNYAKLWTGTGQKHQQLQQLVLNCSLSEYRLLTRQALAYAEQLADYAVGMLPKEMEKPAKKGKAKEQADEEE